MTEYNAGNVLHLAHDRGELAAGTYVLLAVVNGAAVLCLAGENDAGNVCTTDTRFSVGAADLAADFRPVGVRLPVTEWP